MKEILLHLERIEQLTLLAAKRILDINDASALTGLSVDTLRRKVSARQISASRPNGRDLYFDRQDLESYLMRGRIASLEELEQNTNARLRKGVAR